MKFQRLVKVLLLWLACTACLAAQAAGPKVVASTYWTAAIARAAGVKGDILIIAPAELRHPPEYEIKPSDLLAVKGADLLVYGGYEKFAERILEACGRPEAGLKLNTDNRPETLVTEARKVAERLGTLEAWSSWAEGFKSFTEASRARVLSGLGSGQATVVVQSYLKAWMEWMGFKVAGTFGPGEPSPAQVLSLSKTSPAMVIDNYHNPAGRALAESLGVKYCLLINFPGKDGSVSLEDVYLHNEAALLKATVPGKP
jgi:hypothetical protein